MSTIWEDIKQVLPWIIGLVFIAFIVFDVFLFKEPRLTGLIFSLITGIFKIVFKLIMVYPLLSIPFTVYIMLEIRCFFREEDTLALRGYEKFLEMSRSYFRKGF